ncbi:MAG: class I SAM-dependent methyltransferase [Thermodesulfobacteriota bacterium]
MGFGQTNTKLKGVIDWGPHRGPILDEIKGYSVIDCEVCGFKHVVPLPTLEELAAVYRLEYYTVDKPLYLERYREDLDWWNLVYRERYETFEELLSPTRRRLLDVGSGPGFFLRLGQERGWQTLGIEPSARAAAHSRSLGVEVLEDFLTEETAAGLGTFDVVHLSEVLEHIPDPRGMLAIVQSLLAPAGLLCVVVPNDYNPLQNSLRAVCGFEPWWVGPPHHLNYFDFASLSRLVESTGFEVVLTEATFPIDMFLLMGDNYVDNDLLGRQCHQKRKNLEQNLAKAGMTDLKRRLYKALASLGLGREVQIFAKKI